MLGIQRLNGVHNGLALVSADRLLQMSLHRLLHGEQCSPGEQTNDMQQSAMVDPWPLALRCDRLLTVVNDSTVVGRD